MASQVKGISIDISADTSKFQKALNQLDAPIKKINTELKDINSALKLDPKNTELLSQKQEVLGRKIAETKDKLNALKQAQQEMGSYSSLTDEQKAKYNQLSAEIVKTEDSLKQMNKEMLKTQGIDLEKLKNGLKKVGEVALDVSKKLLQVSSAIGGALASVVGLGVKSYASLEQNIGGVETLFAESEDEIKEYEKFYGKTWEELQNDTEGFTTTADNVIANAAAAYKTAGVSANEYMAGVNSFAASLMKATKGNSMEAMEVADMAFIDMADNANKMGTDMQSIQNAYQGFAKQNYGMLDNLKLGYGGSKKEMERLLKDAQKLTGVKYDINNLADVYNAIHAVQEELGVAGTTAKEAEETIGGSAASMKAAFDNFLNGSGSPEQLADAVTTFLGNIANTIGKLAPSILKGLVTLFKTITPKVVSLLLQMIPQLIVAVQDMIQTLCTMITSNTTQIANTITTILNQIIMFITNNLPMIIDVGIKLVIALVDGIVSAIPTLAEALPQLITTIINVLIENIPAVLMAAIQLLMAIVEAIPVIVESLIDSLPTIIETITTTLIDNAPTLLAAAVKLLFEIVKAIPKIAFELALATPKMIVSIVKTLWNNRGKILDAGKKMLLNLRDGIINNLSQLMSKIKEIPSKVKDWLVEGIQNLKDVGDNFVKGIWQGISDGLGWIKDKIKGWCGDVISFCKKILGIKSPSKVMADEVGHWMGEGIGVGFVDAMDDVEKQMANSIPVESLIQDVNGAMSSLNRGIQTSINPNINPNITYDMNYQMMAKAVKDALSDMEIALDDREVGKFVTKTITEEIYGGTL